MNTETENAVAQSLVQHKGLLNAVWQAMRLRLVDTGLEDSLNTLPRPEVARYEMREDPFDTSKTLIGTWRDTQGATVGEIQVRDNGSVYAELDVIRNHPTDARWFVESVTAWGNQGDIKTELKLLSTV